MKKLSIGERIRKQRIDNGISIERLSEILKVDRSTIYRYETNAINNMSYKVLIPLARALNTTPAFILGLTETVEENNSVEIANLIDSLNEQNKKKAIEFIHDLLELQKFKENQ